MINISKSEEETSNWFFCVNCQKTCNETLESYFQTIRYCSYAGTWVDLSFFSRGTDEETTFRLENRSSAKSAGRRGFKPPPAFQSLCLDFPATENPSATRHKVKHHSVCYSPPQWLFFSCKRKHLVGSGYYIHLIILHWVVSNYWHSVIWQ